VDSTGTPLSDWLARLETVSSQEIDLSLDRVSIVLDRLALPAARTVLHVAGTNGKGSSAAMLESFLRHGGARVGCYTSPHIRRYNERIRVDGRDASDDEIVSALERVEAERRGEELTYFEFGTLAALVVFADAGLDTLVLEVGMGGRLDAVNAVEPEAGLITNIGLDHCDWLGTTVEAIGREKAGIMRPGKPVVFGARDMPASVGAHADAVGARLIAAGRDYDWWTEGDGWTWQGTSLRLDGLARPALAGDHQVANAAGVLTTLEAAGFTDLLNREAVGAALGRLHVDGRVQAIDTGTRWIVDVAHNPHGARALASALPAHEGKTIAILGMLDDKDVEGVVAHLDRRVDRWIAVRAASPRAIEAGELARRIKSASQRHCQVADSLQDALDRAEGLARDADRVLITGSFYLVGPALEALYSRPKR